jgi:iron complex transport system ATP-binding protein
MLEARHLSITVDGHALLTDVDLAVPAGRVVVLIGPNGAGKSTLLRALCGEIAPASGAVLIDDRRLDGFSAGELARRRAVVPQASVLAFPFTVLEVAMLGITVPGFEPSDLSARKAARAALDVVAMGDLADRLYVTLSGGERQRVHIARALCQLGAAPRRAGETACFLLDEPTASLDLAHQGLVLSAIRRQADLGYAVLVVLHDLNLAVALADRMVLLVRGTVTAAGDCAEVLRDDLLRAAYGCEIHTNRTPEGGRPFVLPPAMFLARSCMGPPEPNGAAYVPAHNP